MDLWIFVDTMNVSMGLYYCIIIKIQVKTTKKVGCVGSLNFKRVTPRIPGGKSITLTVKTITNVSIKEQLLARPNKCLAL